MYKVFVPVVVMLFSGVIAFMAANTVAYVMFPIFDNMSQSLPFMGSTNLYGQAAPGIRNSFFIALWIVVCIPVAYLLFRLLRKERQPQQQEIYYPGGQW